MVLAFVAAAWVAVVAILAVAPDVYDQALGLPIVDRRQFEVGFLAALSIFLVIVATGVVRRWRWMFWLILVAFLAGVIRLPASGGTSSVPLEVGMAPATRRLNLAGPG